MIFNVNIRHWFLGVVETHLNSPSGSLYLSVLFIPHRNLGVLRSSISSHLLLLEKHCKPTREISLNVVFYPSWPLLHKCSFFSACQYHPPSNLYLLSRSFILHVINCFTYCKFSSKKNLVIILKNCSSAPNLTQKKGMDFILCYVRTFTSIYCLLYYFSSSPSHSLHT